MLANDRVRTFICASLDKMATYDTRTRTVLVGTLSDAIRIYTGPMIEQAITALALLPADNQWRRTMGAAADVIAYARSQHIDLESIHNILLSEVSQ